MDNEVKKAYDKAAAYAQRIFRKQAPGSLSKAVTVKYIGNGKFQVGYGSKGYGIYVDYGTYANEVNPLNIPDKAKWSPKGYGPDKKGIEPRFFTVMGNKEREKFLGLIQEALDLQLEKEFENLEL